MGMKPVCKQAPPPAHLSRHIVTSILKHPYQHILPNILPRTHAHTWVWFIAWTHALMFAQQMMTDSAKQAAFLPPETRTHARAHTHTHTRTHYSLPPLHTRAQVWFLAWMHVLMFTPFAEVRPMANVALAYLGSTGVGVRGIRHVCLGVLQMLRHCPAGACCRPSY